MSSSTGQLVLFQYGTDPMDLQFEDPQEPEDSQQRVAFTTEKVVQVPNVVLQVTRHDQWASRHTSIMGPRNAFLYFGPSNSPGQLAYGNGERVHMSYYLRKKKEASNSRYFNAQGGKEFKWKSISPQRMELCDSLNVYAVWERAPPGLEHDAQVTLSATSLTFVTEVLTTLSLNLVAKQLNFW